MSRTILGLQSATGPAPTSERDGRSSGLSWSNCNGNGGSWFTWAAATKPTMNEAMRRVSIDAWPHRLGRKVHCDSER